jgi:hypothetical protein
VTMKNNDPGILMDLQVFNHLDHEKAVCGMPFICIYVCVLH